LGTAGACFPGGSAAPCKGLRFTVPAGSAPVGDAVRRVSSHSAKTAPGDLPRWDRANLVGSRRRGAPAERVRGPARFLERSRHRDVAGRARSAPPLRRWRSQ